MAESVLTQARSLVDANRYLEALDVLQKRVDSLVGEPIDPDELVAEAFERDLETYLLKYDAGAMESVLHDALECVTLCAAASELCTLSLGLGMRAAAFMRTANTVAENLPEPFSEMLRSTPAYFRMMWFYEVVGDRGEALRDAYRISAAYPDSHYDLRCRKMREADDWDIHRTKNVNIYYVAPDENPETLTENTLLGVPGCQEAYQAAVYDSALSSFELGRHTKQNDTYWMYSLFYLIDSISNLIAKLPVAELGATERDELYDALLAPLVEHIAYQQNDGFKSEYKSPAKVALRELDKEPFAGLAAIRRLRAIQSGEVASESALVPHLPIDAATGYALSTAFKDRRVFLSSSFGDMLSERDYLLTYIFPDVDGRLREYGMRLTPVDLRGIKLDGSEEWYDKECFRYCMSEIDRSDSMIGLVGSRYGWVMFDEQSEDPAMAAIVSKTASEHGIPLSEMMGKSITHIEMMYGLRALKREQCYFYLRDLTYTGAGSWGSLKRIGFADGDQYVPDGRQNMIVDAYGIRQIAPEDEPGANVQYYSARFNGERISGVERLGENIRTKLLHDAIFRKDFKRRNETHARMLAFWSDMAHQTIPHPRLPELLAAKEQFIMLTGPEGIGKTVLLAQFWEAMREQAPVVVMEALLTQEDGSLPAMLSHADELAARLRLELPKERRQTKDVYFIFDGLERTINRGERIVLADDFGDNFPEGYHVIVCLHENAAMLPKKFKVIKLDEPPAPAEALVRNTVFRTGKQLDSETVERVATLARRSGGNPLYTDLLTRRLVYLLQDEFKRDSEGWFDQVTAELDGSVASAAYLIVDRTARALEDPQDRALAKALLGELIEAEHGSLTLAELSCVLKARSDAAELGADADFETWVKRLQHVLILLRPLLLFDSSMKSVTLAHRSLLGTGARAKAQRELIEAAELQNEKVDEGEQMSFSYLLAAVIAVALAGVQLLFPFSATPLVSAIVQTLAFASLFTPLAILKDFDGDSSGLANIPLKPLYWVAMAVSGLLPVLLFVGGDLPASLAGIAQAYVRCYPSLVVAVSALFCANRAIAALGKGNRGAGLVLLAVVVTFVSAIVGIVVALRQAQSMLLWRMAGLVFLAMTYYMCKDADKQGQR